VNVNQQGTKWHSQAEIETVEHHDGLAREAGRARSPAVMTPAAGTNVILDRTPVAEGIFDPALGMVC